MAIDLASVNWLYVVLMAAFVFVAALLGSLISFRNRVGGAVLAAILFAAAFVYWTYYPHPSLPGPISVGSIAPTPATGPAPAPAAVVPSNPVSTLSQAPAAAPAPGAK